MSKQRELTAEAEIKDSLLRNLSIVFGESEAVDPSAFRQKYNSLIDSAIALSAPFLSPETIRYQTMLLSLSVFFISISLFRIGGIKIGDTLVSVDSKLLVVYGILILTVSLIFILKARLDYRRAGFVRERNADAVTDLRNLINVGLEMRNIQLYFWLEISDILGHLYKTYDEFYEASRMQRSEFEPTPMQVVTLDRTGLNKIAETKAEIARLEAYLASFTAELDEDKEQFRRESVDILAGVAVQDTRTKEIRAASEQYLEKWFKTRTALSNKNLNFAVENSKHDAMVAQADALVKVLERIRSIQRIYLGIEIAAPVVFAFFCILYVRFG